jgi:ribosomal protein S18 acetylase RimI-like enzyme
MATNMDNFALIPADTLAPEQLVVAFNRGFEGYLVPMVQTVESLAAMIETNDVELRDSLVLTSPPDPLSHGERGDLEMCGVALLAVRGERGWVAGMGIAPEWRGRGVGEYLMRALVERARARGLRTLHLEVLEANTAAYRLYERVGFRTTRQLLVYTGPLDTAKLARSATLQADISPIWVDEALEAFEQTHTVAPPWQREPDSLGNTGQRGQRLTGLALRQQGAMQAYLLSMPARGGVALMDIGSRAPTSGERLAQGMALLYHLLANAPETSVRAINVPPGDLLGEVLDTLCCPVVNHQREMFLNLS